MWTRRVRSSRFSQEIQGTSTIAADTQDRPETREVIWSADRYLRFLALALGLLVGIVGTAFRLGATRGFLLYARLLTLGNHRSVSRGLFAALSGAVMVSGAVYVTRRLAPEAAGSGIQEIEGELAGLRPPVRWARVLPVKFFGGLLAMSAGLVLGREGPTVHIGGSVGAALTRWRPMGGPRNNTLIGAGSAAGLAVAFNAPLGGILFAFEEIRREFPLNSMSAQCVTLTTVTAIIVSHLIAGAARVLPIRVHKSPTLVELGLMLPFAIIMGTYGVLLNAALVRTLAIGRRLSLRLGWLLPAAITGAGIGLLVWSYPEATGGGEELVTHLLQRPEAIGVLILLMVVRVTIFNVSYAMSTPGGIFFPIVGFGAIAGLCFADLIGPLLFGVELDPGKCAVAGMAALLAATVRAPLTGLALVIEMTGNYQLVLMSLLAAIIADLTADSLGGRSIYEQLLNFALRSEGSNLSL